MRKQVLDIIYNNKELKQYLRAQPIWYRNLSRRPMDINTFQFSAKQYYQKTLPQRVEKIANSIELASMMLQMFGAMKNND